jgi:hypothetical protein
VFLHALAGSSLVLALAGCSLEVPGSGPMVTDPSGGLTGGDDSGLPPYGSPDDAGAVVSPGYPPDASISLLDGGAALDAAPSGCTIDGRYAVEVEFDVSWVGTQFAGIVPVISPGEGKLSFIVVGEFVTGATGTEFAFRNCQASVPEFISTLPQERYQVRFSNAVWDSPNMPNFRGAVTTCREPGCALRSTPIRALIGAALSDPMASWPTSAARGQWPDHDGDGRKGVAAFMVGPSAGGGIEYPPVDLLGLRRVQKLDLGMRVSLTLNGKRDSCDAISGVVEDGAIDTRGLDCVATSRPMSCEADEVQFLDDNLPAWTVRQGTFRGIRVKDGDSCDQVRELSGIGRASPP